MQKHIPLPVPAEVERCSYNAFQIQNCSIYHKDHRKIENH